MGDLPKKIMHIGKAVLAKHEGKVQEFIVKDFRDDTLFLSNGIVEIQRYFWEVRKIDEKEE